MRRHEFVFTFLAVLMLLINTAYGQKERWIAFDPSSNAGTPPDVQVVESDENQTVIRIKISGMWSEEVYEGKIQFQSLYLPNFKTTGEVGKAAMPVIRELLGIISDAEKTSVVQVSIKDSLMFDGINVFPYLKPVQEESETKFVIDSSFYAEDIFYPTELGQSGPIGEWGDLRIANIEINPIKFNPLKHLLIAYTELEVRIVHKGNIQDLQPISPFWQKMYGPVILNGPQIWKYFPKWPFNYLRGKYLIITGDKFVSQIMPLATWKVMKGLDVTIVKVSTIGATDTAIKKYIQDFYEDNLGYRIYVLLVGDVGDIPVHYYPGLFNSDIASDHYYACVRGSDDYPDLYIGRISVVDDASLTVIVDNILQYEQSPPFGNWVRQALLAAHEQNYPYKYTQCKQEIKDYSYNWITPVFTTAFGGQTGISNTTVTNAINSGMGIVNYRGHGDYTMWWHWNLLYQDFTSNDVINLNNGDYTPIVYAICCRNNWIDYTVGDVIGETWLKSGKAVAHLGATRDSPTLVNHDFDKYLFKATFDDKIVQLGQVMNYAKNRVLNDYTASDPNALGEARMYMLLGDPEMTIRTEPSWPFIVVHPPWIKEKVPQLFEVKVNYNGDPVPGAVVCLWKEDDIHVNAYTNNDGVASFDIESDSPGPLHVTVTKDNYKPWHSEAMVKVAPGFELAVDKVLAWPGKQNVLVPVFLSNPDSVGGWEVLTQYDASGCTVVGATLCDSIYIPEDEKWYYAPWAFDETLRPEYFNGVPYAGGHADMVRTVGIMNMPAPAQVVLDIPPSEKTLLYCLIANIKQEWDGQDIAFNFYTENCTDNTLSSCDGYTVWGPNSSSAPVNTCPERADDLRVINLIDGASIGYQEVLSGDINLNGVPYEVGDAIVFINYLLYGPDVLIDPSRQTFASDVNRDGMPWTIADLVMLINIINGYQQPLASAAPAFSEASADVSIPEKAAAEIPVSATFDVPLGGAYFVFNYDNKNLEIGTPTLSNRAQNMTLASHVENGKLKVVIYSLDGERLEPGSGPLFSIPLSGEGNLSIYKAEFADTSGNSLKVITAYKEMPDQLPLVFSLAQNYPNPFNPRTAIVFTLKKNVNVSLKIYNITGQLIRTLTNEKMDAGQHTKNWDGMDDSGRMVSSGIYFYQIIAGDFKASRKMVMMK